MDYFGPSSRSPPASGPSPSSPGRHVLTPRGTGAAASGQSPSLGTDSFFGAASRRPTGLSLDGTIMRASPTSPGPSAAPNTAGSPTLNGRPMTQHSTAFGASGVSSPGATFKGKAPLSSPSASSTTPRLSPPPMFQSYGHSNPFFATAAAAAGEAMPGFPLPSGTTTTVPSFNFGERRGSVASSSSSSSSPSLRATAPFAPSGGSSNSTRHSSPAPVAAPSAFRATTPLSPGKHSAPSPTFSSPAHGPSPLKKGVLARNPTHEGPDPGRSILDHSDFTPGDRLPLPTQSPSPVGFGISKMGFSGALASSGGGNASWPPVQPPMASHLRPSVAERRSSGSASLPPPSTNGTNGVSAEQAVRMVLEEGAETLVLDVRTASAFRNQRIRGSVGVNVPTTLLRRPAYNVEKIEAVLETPAERDSFARYRTTLPSSMSDSSTPLKRILVVDANTSITSLPAAHPLLQILGKFSAAGCAVQLGHVIGGFRAVAAVQGVEAVLESGASPSSSMPSTPRVDSAPGSAMPSPAATRSGMMRMSLPMPAGGVAAFSGADAALPTSRQGVTNPLLGKVQLAQPSTPSGPHRPSPRSRPSHTHPPPGSPSSSYPYSSSHSRLGSRRPSGAPKMSLPASAFTNATVDCSTGRLGEVAQQLGAPGGLGEGTSSTAAFVGGFGPASAYTGPSSPDASPASTRASNPFFDNIRQLSEGLSLERSLKNLPPVSLPHLTPSSISKLPPWLRKLLAEDETERATRLAHEFYDLEKAECSRLQEVMKWHCGAGGKDGEGGPSDAHPFSISAGVELGYKNRYKNIWPWEHARVRLGNANTCGNDYVNASTIELAGTEKRYIATQGPLQATYDDFWQVVAQEDVGVIVMLTKQREEGREKCGDYLRSGTYGDVVVKVEGSEGCGDAPPPTDGFFGFFPSPSKEKPDGEHQVTIAKTLTVRLLSRPDLPAKQIRHVQYVAWPDFDVPPDPQDVLELVETVNDHARQVVAHNKSLSLPQDSLGAGPMIVHCSAGVGRTGSFIVIDTMLDVLRQQIAAMHKVSDAESSSDASSRSSGASSISTAPTSTADEEEDLISPMRQGRKWMDIDSPEPDQGSFPNRVTRAMSLSLPPAQKDGDSIMEGVEPSSAPPASRSGWERLCDPRSKGQKTPLPCFLETRYCDVDQAKEIPPLWQSDPILPTVNELREQRMSMVANYRQYVYVHEAILAGLIKELRLHTTA